MKQLLTRKYLIWLFFSTLLIGSFFIGLFTPLSTFLTGILLIGLFLVFILSQSLVILYFLTIKLNYRKKLCFLIMHNVNIIFSFIIGYFIYSMESNSKYNFGFVMIPLLIGLSYVLIDKSQKDLILKEDHLEKNLTLKDKKESSFRPSIEFDNKKFIFSTSSLIILGIGTPILAYLTYFFFDLEFNYWLHEIVVKQTVLFLNLFFNMGASAIYNPIGKYHWSFNIPGRSSIFFETFCTGIQAINVFVGIIVCIPHSQDKKTSYDILWRKTKSLIVSSFIFYIVNIIRMLIQIYLYYLGYPWESIHVSISAASSFIAAIIILLLHRWIPEFIISIIYSGTLIKNKIISLNKKKIKKL
ncbi:MAG: archaeosortase H [Candidatus Hodarchaeota archaeon]